MNTIVTLQIAIRRAWMVAKKDFHRALGYLLEAKVSFASAVRYCLTAAAA